MRSRIPRDILIHTLISFISYYKLDDVLTTLCFKKDEIESIKKKEYQRRLVYTDNEMRITYKIEGKLHCEDGPAEIDNYRIQYWYNNGELHRLDGPAIIDDLYSVEEWYVNGQMHRLDGPARIWEDGDMEWWVNGELHNPNGPAVVYANGKKEYYINGKRIK